MHLQSGWQAQGARAQAVGAQNGEEAFSRGGKWHEWTLDYDEDFGAAPTRIED